MLPVHIHKFIVTFTLFFSIAINLILADKVHAATNEVYGRVWYERGGSIISYDAGIDTPATGTTVTTACTGYSNRSATVDSGGSFNLGQMPATRCTTTIRVPDGRSASYSKTFQPNGGCSNTPNNCGNHILNVPFTPPASPSNRLIFNGSVFNDNDRDGTKDAGETGYAGAIVRAVNQTNGTSVNGTTNSSGNYNVEMNGTGTFCIAFPNVPSGYTATTTQGPTRCSTVTGSGNTITTTFDFGIVTAATPTPVPPTQTPTPVLYTIVGSVHNDSNKNGYKDSGELNYNGTPAITASRGTVTNNSNGTYTITNLSAGTVTISYTSLPPGYTLTYPLNGPPSSFQVTVGPGCNTNGARGARCQ